MFNFSQLLGGDPIQTIDPKLPLLPHNIPQRSFADVTGYDNYNDFIANTPATTDPRRTWPGMGKMGDAIKGFGSKLGGLFQGGGQASGGAYQGEAGLQIAQSLGKAIPVVGPIISALAGLGLGAQKRSYAAQQEAERQRQLQEQQWAADQSASNNLAQAQYTAVQNNAAIPNVPEFRSGGVMHYGQGGTTPTAPGAYPATLHGGEVVIPRHEVTREGDGNWQKGAAELVMKYNLPTVGGKSFFHGGVHSGQFSGMFPGFNYQLGMPQAPLPQFPLSMGGPDIPLSPEEGIPFINVPAYKSANTPFAPTSPEGAVPFANAPAYPTPYNVQAPFAPGWNEHNAAEHTVAPRVNDRPFTHVGGVPGLLGLGQFGVGLAGTLRHQRPRYQIGNDMTDFVGQTRAMSKIGFSPAERAMMIKDIRDRERAMDAQNRAIGGSSGQYLSRRAANRAQSSKALLQMAGMDAGLRRKNMALYGQAAGQLEGMRRQQFGDDWKDWMLKQQNAGNLMKTGGENVMGGLVNEDREKFNQRLIDYWFKNNPDYLNMYYGIK